MTMDYQSPERPRESWTERNERDPTSFKRDPDDRQRRLSTSVHPPQSNF